MKLSENLKEALVFAAAGLTFNEMTDRVQRKQVKQRVYDWYVLLWTWAAPNNCWEQEKFYMKCGSLAFWRRINRCRAFVSEHSSLKLTPYELPEEVDSLCFF